MGTTKYAAMAAEMGYAPFPLAHLAKTPAVNWTKWSTNERQRDLWLSSEDEPGMSGYGIACGPSGIVVVDIDQHDASANGEANFAALDIPPSPCVVTTPKGRHMYYRQPADAVIYNSAGRLAPGVDVRGSGGYVVGPGSITSDGVYESEDFYTAAELPLAPPALVDALNRPDEAPTAAYSGPQVDTASPYERAALEGVRTDLQECQRRGWTGPGWDDTTYRKAYKLALMANSPAFAITHEQAESFLLEHAPTDPGFGPDEHLTKWRNAVDAVGDSQHAAPEGLTTAMPAEDDSEDLYGNVALLLAGGLPEPTPPSILARTDGQHTFYRGKDNWLFGDPECGKTWVAAAAIAEVLAAGGKALFLDLDHNGMQDVVNRLLRLGAPYDALADRERFRYSDAADTPAKLSQVIEDSVTWGADIAVIDSVGELIPLLGKESNSNDDFTTVHRMVGRPLMNADTAVVYIDHLSKNSDSRKFGQTGGMAKRRAARGASLRVTVKEPYVPGIGGASAIHVNKNTSGHLRAASVPGESGSEMFYGVFRLDTANADVYTWDIHPTPGAAKSAKTETRAALDAETLADTFPDADDIPSIRAIREILSCGQSRAEAAKAAYCERFGIAA